MIEIHGWLLLAQVLSFLVAVFILWRFFWGPITEMMDKRRRDIAKDIDDARTGREEVEKIRQEFEAELAGIDRRARETIDGAVAEGQAAREEILRAARDEAKAFLANAKDEIATERRLATAELRRETVDLAVLIAEKIVKKSVDQATRERMLDEFIDGLRQG
ncbi:MAG: F0F1 ATP synthase subunit B [bacterium]